MRGRRHGAACLCEFGISMRRLQMADQFHAKGFGIVGLQETRTRDAACRPSGQFTCWSSAADKGNGGLELWVHGCLAPDARTALVLISESRLLAVRLRRSSRKRSVSTTAVLRHGKRERSFPHWL